MKTTTAHQPPKTPPWVNATMGWLLRSPLHSMVDRGITLLTVTGRRTGRRFSFPVQYVRDGDTLWVMSSGGPEKTWWRNLVGGATVEVLLRGRTRTGIARAATFDADPATVTEGVRRYMARFPRFEKRFGLRDADAETFAAFARDAAIVRIDLTTGADPPRGSRLGT